MKKIIFTLILGMLVCSLVGCGNGNESAKATSINVVGSTSVTPVATELAKEYSKKHTNLKIDVQGVGSTPGVKAAHDQTADIGMASRDLKSGEKEWNLKEYVIAYDGIAVVVHPSNKLTNLDFEDIKKIFSGEIKNWKELGAEDEEILVVSRESGSGTRGAFEEITKLYEKNSEGKKISKVKNDALIADSNGAVMANIAKKENAIGYMSLSYVDDSIKALSIDNVIPSTQAIKDNKYKISRPFIFITNGEISDEVKGFIDYVFSEEGQKIVSKKLISVRK